MARRKGAFFGPPPGASLRAAPVTISASLKRNQLFSGGGGFSSREVALLIAAVNHPGILARNAENIVNLRLESRELARLAAALVDCLAEGGAPDSAKIREILGEKGLNSLLKQAEQALSPAEWWARPQAETQSAEIAWRQAADLHERVSGLHKSLKEAENRFAEEGSESALGAIRDIQSSIESLEGGLVTLDGFQPLPKRAGS